MFIFMAKEVLEVKKMEGTEDKDAMKPEQGKENKKKQEGGRSDLPYCTTAPSAEHHRADSDDEPCDDGTGGNA